MFVSFCCSYQELLRFSARVREILVDVPNLVHAHSEQTATPARFRIAMSVMCMNASAS
jgi:hypothetical protein